MKTIEGTVGMMKGCGVRVDRMYKFNRFNKFRQFINLKFSKFINLHLGICTARSSTELRKKV